MRDKKGGKAGIICVLVYIFIGGWSFGALGFIIEPSISTFVFFLISPVIAVFFLIFPPWSFFVAVVCVVIEIIVNNINNSN